MDDNTKHKMHSMFASYSIMMILRLLLFLCLWVHGSAYHNLLSGLKLDGISGRDRHHRHLLQPDEQPTPPKRKCGQVIGVATADDVNAFFTDYITTLLKDFPEYASFGSLAVSTVTSIIKYGVHAQVICTSCNEIMQLYSGEEFLTADGKHSFASYCGPERYGHDVVHSALMLVPVDSFTGATIPGQLKTSVSMHETILFQQDIPSEIYPENLVTAIENLADESVGLYCIIGGLIAASSGTINVAPDYIGYGQSYLSPRGYTVLKLYQQAAAVSWLKAKNEVQVMSNGCTMVQNAATIGGYSEGGSSAVAAALAYQAMGLDIIGVSSGAGPFEFNAQIQFIIDQIDNNPNRTIYMNTFVPLIGAALSSTNPDLPNSNRGQDFLLSEWMVEGNFSRNALAWVSSTQDLISLYALVPNNATDIMNTALLQAVRASIATGGSNFCVEGDVSEINLLCDAMQSNSLLDDVAAVTFPLVICQSPDDNVVVQVPDLAANGNISKFTLFGTGPIGDHFDSALFCLLGVIYPFTSFGTFGSANNIVPLENSNVCMPAGVAEPSSTAPRTSSPTPDPLSPTPPGTPSDPPSMSGAGSSVALLSSSALSLFLLVIWA